MKRPLLGFFFLLIAAYAVKAQDKWDLQRCVTYAMQNNISVKQADIQARISSLQLKLTEAGRLPNVGFSSNGGYNFGRSINPATNSFENKSIFFSNFQLQSSVNLFNWFSQRYAVEADRLTKQAADASTDKARNDIALNVAVAYLQALLASEQIDVSSLQIGQRQSQLDNIRKQVKAGALPELNAVELEAQLATDSATYIGNVSTYQQDLIQLKALLNLDMAVDFDIEKPDVTSIPLEPLADLQPASVYQLALKNLPQQRVNQFRYQAALKNIQVARASMFPSISAFANIGSRYSSLFPDQENYVVTPSGKLDTLGYVETAPGTKFYAVRPGVSVVSQNTPFGKQVFNVNLSQAVGLNLSIPIFNNRRLRTVWDRARLDAEGIQLQVDQDNLTLQQDIYGAYNNAISAQQRYLSARKGVEAAEKAFDFSQKRYGAGLLQTIELITNQNSLFRSRLDALAAQFEFVFRMKLLEFYKGEGMKL